MAKVVELSADVVAEINAVTTVPKTLIRPVYQLWAQRTARFSWQMNAPKPTTH